MNPDRESFLRGVDEDLANGADGVEAVLHRTLRHFAAESGTVHMLGDDGVLHLCATGPGMPDAVIDLIRRIPVGKGMAGLAVERDAPVTACNLQTDDTGDVRPGAKLTGLQGAIVVPMRDGGHVVGAFGIGNQAERTFDEQEIELLYDVAARVARCARPKTS
ncbi:MAG: GAF domain-containing protein [Planctomycetes bacterium]|nr:GAF domain-containing protein [Planctomycetota bacterium]